MPHAVPGYPARDDPSTLGEKIPEQTGILKIYRGLLQAKPARPAPLKQPPATPITVTAITAACTATHSFHHCLLVRPNQCCSSNS
jgi:hypothetical protein